MTKARLISLMSVLLFLSSCGLNASGEISSASSSGLAAMRQIDKETTILALQATPISGGINPNYRAYELLAKVRLGGNPCVANGATVTLETEPSPEGIIIKAVHHIGQESLNRVCTMEYAPVTAVIAGMIHFERGQEESILVKNYQSAGSMVRLTSITNEPSVSLEIPGLIHLVQDLRPADGALTEIILKNKSSIVFEATKKISIANRGAGGTTETVEQLGTAMTCVIASRSDDTLHGISCAEDQRPVDGPLTILTVTRLPNSKFSVTIRTELYDRIEGRVVVKEDTFGSGFLPQ